MLILLPFDKRLDWRHPPWATIALIVVNCAVFFLIQGGDGRRWDEAANYYFSTDLPGIELPAYADYLDQQGEARRAARVREALQATLAAREFVLMSMQYDQEFLRRLQRDQVVQPTAPHYTQWKEQRREFESRLTAIVTDTYAFHRDRPVTYLTSMFLHANPMHLFGNMLFLFIVGFAVERVLGSGQFLFSYLLGGLCAIGLWAIVYTDRSCLGASGAITATMALYAMLFGLRRIRFFYWVLFYFDYVTAPAIILLLLWILNEIFDLFAGYAGIAYVAHIGGLLGGAGIGWLQTCVLKTADTGYLDESARQEQRMVDYETALQHMEALRFDKAKVILQKIYSRHPNDREIQRLLYHASKPNPESEDYHRLARELMLAAYSEVNSAHETFLDYSQAAKPGPRLSAAELLALSVRFSKADFVNDAERILTYLLRKTPQAPALAEGLLAVAEAYQRQHNREKFARYARLLADAFPQSPAAVMLKQNYRV
ncbi:MAG: rhomboid family intramembrane serine protease [Sulfuricaulis sp.]